MNAATTPAPETPANEEFGPVATAMKVALFAAGSRSRFFAWVKKAERRLGKNFTVPGRKGLYHLPTVRLAMQPECRFAWDDARALTNRRRNAR